MRINVGDKVRVDASMGYLHNVMGETGEVVHVYDFLVPMAVVKFENGVTAKVEVSNLRKVEPKAEIPESAKQITKAEFMAALQKITSPEAIFSGKSVDPIHALTEGLSAILFGHKAARIIFEDKDVAILTEDDLVGALWDACDPAVMSEETNRKHSAFDGLLMSVSAVIVLRDLVTILFGEPEND